MRNTLITTVATLFLGLLHAPAAMASDTVEIGVIRQEDITVVQRVLYPKLDRSEIGVHLGIMPFDPYVTTPNAQVSYTMHMSERMGFNVIAGGGYGLKSAVYRRLESPTYGVAPYAYRYLASLLAGAEFSPIYAKLNLNGARVLHFDVYGVGRLGLTVEQSVLPDGTIGFGPTLSLGIGSRVFVGKNTAIHLALRDDLVLQRRAITQSTHLKQNADVTLGLTFLSSVKDR